MTRLALALLLLICASTADASRFPPNSNTVDPRNAPYGAIPNDAQLDTAAFQAAATAAVHYGHIFEITGQPGDVYLLDAPIKSQILHGSPATLKWVANWIVLCDPGVIIRIPDNSPAFSNAAAPQGLFQYGSTVGGVPSTVVSGGGVEGYRNTFSGYGPGAGRCIIDTGTGNPGASAINLVGNNRSAFRHLLIRSGDGQGVAGIDAAAPWPGPALIEDVEVQGYQYCIRDKQVQYGLVYKDVTCIGQSVYGISANSNVAVVKGLHSVNTVPAILSFSGAAHLVLIDSVLEGGAANKPALALGPDSKAYLRNVSAVGSAYQALIKQGTTVRTDLGMQRTEWISHPGFSPTGGPIAALGLPDLAPPPVFTSTNPADWADPRSYGANPNDKLDDRAGILAAIASGRPILQLVQGHAGGSTQTAQSAYYISDTIDLPCSVRRVEGMESRILATASFPSGHPFFRAAAAGCPAGSSLTIERMWPGGQGGPMLVLGDARTTYVRDAYMASLSTGIEALAGSGPLFLDDVVPSGLRIYGPHQVRAVQLNPEEFDVTDGIINEGTLDILGMKTEGMAAGGMPTLTARPGGKTRIDGGMLMPCVHMGGAVLPGPGFVVEDGADFSATYTNWCGNGFASATWAVQIRETHAGATYDTLATQLPAYGVENGNRVVMPLYRSAIPPTEALLVVGNPAALTGLDAPMRDALTGLGYAVTIADDTASTAADATGKALVVIAPSVSLAAIASKFRDAPTPVVISKGFALPAMAMSATGPAGYVTGKTQVVITDASSPLAACLPAGPVTVYPAAARVQYGRAGAGGTNVAKPEGITTALYGILGYEAGAALESPYIAPARRVGFFAGEDATNLTPQGWGLFGAAAQWAAGKPYDCNP